MFQIEIDGKVRRTPQTKDGVKHWLTELNSDSVDCKVWFAWEEKSTVVRPWKNNKSMMTTSRRIIFHSPVGTTAITKLEK